MLHAYIGHLLQPGCMAQMTTNTCLVGCECPYCETDNTVIIVPQRTVLSTQQNQININYMGFVLVSLSLFRGGGSRQGLSV